MKSGQTEVFEDKNIKIEIYSVNEKSMFFFADKGGIFKLKLVIENKGKSEMDVDVVDLKVKGTGLSDTPKLDLIRKLKCKKTAIKIFYFDSYVEEIAFNIRYALKETDIITSDRFFFFVYWTEDIDSLPQNTSTQASKKMKGICV